MFLWTRIPGPARKRLFPEQAPGRRNGQAVLPLGSGIEIASLRFSNILDNTDYAHFQEFPGQADGKKMELWGYIDSRDAAQAVRKALEAKFKGAEVFIIANNDTVHGQAQTPNCWPKSSRRAGEGALRTARHPAVHRKSQTHAGV